MLRTRMMVFNLVAAVIVSSAAADEPTTPHVAWIGQDAVIVLEVTKPQEILDRLFSPAVVRAVTNSPAYAALLAQPNVRELLNAVKYFETQHRADLPELLRKLAGGGITVAVGPKESLLVIVESEDGEVLRSIHDFAQMLAQSEAQKQGASGRVKSAEYRGVTGWSFAPDEAHAIIGNRLLFTNRPDALKAALDLRAGEGGTSLLDSPAYQAATRAAGDASLARAFVHLEALKQLPDVNKALAGDENPLSVLLFAPLLAALRESDWLSAGVTVEEDTVALAVNTDAGAIRADAPDGFATPADVADGAPPHLAVPRPIAGVSLFRDLHAFYAAKDELFPHRTSGLIFFENMMGIFFTGRDLTEEVLAETEPDVRIVVAEQRFDERVNTPQPQLPAFAVVMRLRNPEHFRPIAEEAWQKAVGLVNFTRGQQALPGLIIDRPTHEGERYTVAGFAPPADDRAAQDMRFNFRPTLAMPGPYLILSSTEGLARDLIGLLKQEQSSGAPPESQTHTSVEFHGRQLASVLRANREVLVQQNMVEKGNTRQQAEASVDSLFALLEVAEHLAVRTGTRDGGLHMQIELRVDLP